MSKFKVGDRVRTKPGAYSIAKSKVGIITRDSFMVSVGDVLEEHKYVDEDHFHLHFDEGELELVIKGGAEVKPYQRKTYRLLKDTFNIKKGALLQEECDDGTQPYRVLDQDTFVKGSRKSGNTKFASRELIEDQPSWFVEVFAVEPQYMTREELDQWEAFKSRKKPGRKAAVAKPAAKKRGRPAKKAA